jgi:hypothetical protein
MFFVVDDGYTFYGDKPLNELLESWLESIRNSIDGKPTESNIQPKYFNDFMETWFRGYWEQFPNPYTVKPSDLSQIPNAILQLF